LPNEPKVESRKQ
jgi:hypothetical protein